MRIGLAWISRDPLTAITVRYERYVLGLKAMGHEVLTVCLASTAAGYEHSTIEVNDIDQFALPDFWKRLNFDVIITISWMTSPNIIEAMKSGCGQVIAITDSDGIIGVRTYPWTLLKRMVVQHTSLRTKLGAIKHWCQLYLYKHRSAADVRLRSANASDRIIVNSPGAQANLVNFLLSYNRSDLCDRIAVVPYPVDPVFLEDAKPIPSKANRIVVIGRWDDPQKDADLLIAGLESALPRLPETEVLIIGRNGENIFTDLCTNNSRVRYLGTQTPEQVSRLLRESRSLLITSRWESGPIVANEALCLGCSLIGPKWIPTIEWYCNMGPHGTIFDRRSRESVAEAISSEMTAWERGHRNATSMAEHFRQQFSPAATCNKLLNLQGDKAFPTLQNALKS